MAVYEINPNNAGTIELALEGITPLVAYSCQIVFFQLVPAQNRSTRPGVYCEPPADRLGMTSFNAEVEWLQDWGNTPSLSEFVNTNDGAECDFNFTSANPTTCPSFSGTIQVSAGAIGGNPGEVWSSGRQSWPLVGAISISA